jgi:site-specific DNA-cytosine methylase
VDTRTDYYVSIATGGGGLDAGIQRASPSIRPILYMENEAEAQAVLVKNIQERRVHDALVWSDIKSYDYESLRNTVPLGLAGGYPCQPFSNAGKQDESDPRILWPTISNAIRTVKFDWLFFENTASHLRIGGHQVFQELQEMGYVVACDIIAATETGSPHKRERLFILATRGDLEYSYEQGLEGLSESLTERPNELVTRPPSPTMDDEWEEIIAFRPDLAPAIEPEVLRVAHGYKLDLSRESRLRVIGNSVVPDVAQLAWVRLWEELHGVLQTKTNT